MTNQRRDCLAWAGCGPICDGWKRFSAVLFFCLLTAIASTAQTFTTLASFVGSNGSNPSSAGVLVQGLDGNFYGTTLEGGANRCGTGTCGTVFNMTPTGTLTTLHSFNSTDGSLPCAGLVLDTNGNFYGTTGWAGANNFGTVFEMTPAGSLSTVHNFAGTDGSHPCAPLMQATNGKLYGTTFETYDSGWGTVFQMTASGTLTTLYKFAGTTDGQGPYGLLQGSNGNFYGVTQQGGQPLGNYGTVFEITAGGTLTTIHTFDKLDGWFPTGALVQDRSGNLYGTTENGGANFLGEVFRLTPSGTLTTLYSFCSQPSCTDGQGPIGGLVLATDGNLYGTTGSGGGYSGTCASYGCGTIFKVSTSGVFTTLYTFSPTDVGEPFGNGRLLQATDGNFYGMTEYGGPALAGSVYRLSTGLHPFVKTLPTAGKVGTAVTILGTNLTGATSVTFSGKSATFAVVSATEITTSVPAGAVTGKVQVTTPAGKLSSNVVFRVLK